MEAFYRRKASKDGFCARCKVCQKSYHAKWYQRNKGVVGPKNVLRKKAWRKENRDHVRQKGKEYDLKRRDAVYSYRCKNREYLNACERIASKQRYRKNPSKYRHKSMLRHAAKLQRTPKWLSKEQINAIKEVYHTCPPGWHVDHIVPLRGTSVSGLHVPWNLQHLDARLNLQKSNNLQLPTQSA